MRLCTYLMNECLLKASFSNSCGREREREREREKFHVCENVCMYMYEHMTIYSIYVGSCQ